MQAAIREALIGGVNAAYTAAFPTLAIVYDNTPFDRNSPPDYWVEFEIAFAGADQVGMSWSPVSRTNGFLYVTVWCREGSGSKKSLQILDWFSAFLAYKKFGTVNLQVAQPVGGKGPAGWYVEGIKIYWYADSP